VVRERLPERFLEVHKGLFSLRHDEGGDLRDERELRLTLEGFGVEGETVFSEIASGWPLETFRREHRAAEEQHSVWGVPTFIVGGRAAFVRIMNRPGGDTKAARRTVEQVVALFDDMAYLNEFKHTTISN
jgi:hypothetical protein